MLGYEGLRIGLRHTSMRTEAQILANYRGERSTHCSGRKVALGPHQVPDIRSVPPQFCFWENSVVFVPKEPPWSPDPNNASINIVTHSMYYS